MQKVTTSAPGKLILFGEHAVVFGHPCIVTAVDQRMYVTVELNGNDVFHLKAPDLGLEAYSKTINDLGHKNLPRSVAFVEHLYKRFLEKFPQKRGVIITTQSDFSSNFGFGSSSAVTVALAFALSKIHQVELSQLELFELCYQAVIDVQGVGSGFDLAAAIWGGTLYYVSPAKIVEKLAIDNLPLVVGYTGIKADTATLVRMVQAKKQEDPAKIDQMLDQVAEVVMQAKTALLAQNWPELGKLMNQNQDILKNLGVSSVELDTLIEASLKQGALGAKLSGAGGGDCMVALTNPDQVALVESAINSTGEVMKINLSAPGVRCE